MDRVKRAQAALEKAMAARDAAVIAARDDGASWGEIHKATGLSREGIRKIYSRGGTSKRYGD